MTTKKQSIKMFELCFFSNYVPVEMDPSLLVLLDGFNSEGVRLVFSDGCMM
jgi:hypothetical protein